MILMRDSGSLKPHLDKHCTGRTIKIDEKGGIEK